MSSYKLNTKLLSRFIFGGIFITLTISSISAQKKPTRSIVIQSNDTLVETSVLISKELQIKPVSIYEYHWFAFDKIRANQGSFSGQLLHGKYKLYVGDYLLIEEGEFTKGLKSGVWKQWDSSGRLTAILQMKNGQKEGLCKFYKEGILIKEANFRNGIQQGKTVVYEGGEAVKLFYKNGLLQEKQEPKEKKDKKGVLKKVKSLFTKKQDTLKENKKEEKVEEEKKDKSGQAKRNHERHQRQQP